jgi:glutamyl-tRNA synthetase
LPYVVRFSLPTDDQGTQIYEDLVYGHHEHNPYTTEGDFILLKSDGYPTYHLANVIDDHLMEISHVLRGHEWQTSTSKHLLLYKAFNWQPPTYGHFSLLERERGKKLSKRDKENAINPIEIDYYRQKGYYPDAILNFIAVCGGGGFSYDNTIIGKTLDEMIPLFDIKLFSRHAAIVDFKKLSMCQRAHLKRRYQESSERVIEELRQKVLQYYPEKNLQTSIQLQNDYLEKTLNMIDFRISLLDELFTNNLYEYLWKEPEIRKDLIDNVEQFRFVIQQTLTKFDQIRFTHEDVKQFVEEFKPTKISPKQIFRIWRLVLCGCLQGPPVHEIATFFGSDIVRKRFENANMLLDQ